jgi:hypothetical protein
MSPSSQKKPLVVALRTHFSLPIALGISTAIALSGGSLAAAYPGDEPFRERPGSDHAASHRELLFVDPFVADPEQLLIALRPNVETIILEADRGGLEQITEALEQRRDVKAIHIVAHGESGSLNLAGTTLTEASLSGASELLDGWFTDRPERPEILLYACDLARGPEGLAFIERLSNLAGADVAASTDVTGQGGDWELEYHIGEIATASAFNNGLIKGWSHTLANFTVTNTDDSGAGSLRQAILDANATAGADTIDLSGVTGTITLTSDQLTITDDLTISGPGASSLTVSGGDNERVIKAEDADLAIKDFKVSGGRSTAGGGIYFNDPSKTHSLVLQDMAVRDNYAGDGGGGGLKAIANRVAIVYSSITDNRTDTSGGGAFIDASYLDVYYSDISYNEANYSGGGLLQTDGSASVTIRGSTISDNQAQYGGGATLSGTSVTIYSTQVDNNNTYYGKGGGGLSVRTGADSVLNISYATISNNSARYGVGGGLLIDVGAENDNSNAVQIRYTTIENNYATYSGGGIGVASEYHGLRVLVKASSISGNGSYQDGGGGIAFLPSGEGELIIRDSTISENQTNYSNGGGILFNSSDSRLRVTNSTISGNEAYNGGGIAITGHRDVPVTIENSTIVFNDAQYLGGGVFLRNASARVYNSIISENEPETSINFYGDSEVYAYSSLLDNTNLTDGENNIVSSYAGVDENLKDLGGPTKVHELLEGSLAVNAGLDGFDDAYIEYDQRGSGFGRVKGGRLDIGAFESEFSEASDTDGDGTPDDQDDFPSNPDEDTDTDGDGTGDNADDFPSDPDEDTDTDGDGTGDNRDAFPNDPDEDTDTDGDGVGDNRDAFPNDPNRSDVEIVPVPTLSAFLLGVLSALIGLLGLRSRPRRRRRR